MPGLTLMQARQRTNYPIGKSILQTITVTDYFFRFVQWLEPNSGNTYTFNRIMGEIDINWVDPGQLVQKYDTVETEPLAVTLRQAVHKFAVSDYVQDNMSDPFNQSGTQIEQGLRHLARKLAQYAVIGINTNTCLLAAGGGIVAANVASMVPGPYFTQTKDGQTGSLKFDQATSALSFRAPGDQEYGDPVIVAVNGGPYTLRSKKQHLFINLTAGAALPAADAHANLTFSSTTKAPDGLIQLVDPSMLVAPVDAVNGDKVSFEMIDNLVSKMGQYWNPAECAIVLHSNLYNALLSRSRLGGGVTMGEITMEDGIKMQSYRGMPFLQNDFMPTSYLNGNPAHHLFVANMNPDKGFFGVAKGGPNASGFEGQVLDQRSGEYRMMAGEPIMGWKVKALGPARDFAGQEDMVTWTGGFGIMARQGVAARYSVIA